MYDLRPAALPLVVLERDGHARLMATRPLFCLGDGGIGARIRGAVRPVLLDAIHRKPFVWQRRPFSGAALPLPQVPPLTWRDLNTEVAELLRTKGQGWSPVAVRDAVRGHFAVELAHGIWLEEIEAHL